MKLFCIFYYLLIIVTKILKYNKIFNTSLSISQRKKQFNFLKRLVLEDNNYTANKRLTKEKKIKYLKEKLKKVKGEINKCI